MTLSRHYLQFFLTIVIGCASMLTQARQLVPGEYVSEGAYSKLNITTDKTGKLSFSIHSQAEGSCDMKGEIVGGKATLRKTSMKQNCVLRFTQKKNEIAVDGSIDICEQHYCSLANITDQYFQPPTCSTAERSQARKEFKTLYDKKDYAAALAKLEPVLNNCGKILDRLELGWLRNDVALAQYKLQMPERCMATLQPLVEDTTVSDTILANYCDSCTDEFNAKYHSMIKATRTNLRLCKPAK
ncbi:hypothetical protein ACO0LD_16175 [Undibacterium sp. Ji83W]|uniref:hypothetical protein n=1 Tax=Undibacterium sp. Ji83W TaxID=3413043 RepID=UPI003BF359D6